MRQRVSRNKSRTLKVRDKGKVYLVGAGPGDQELLTLKGLRCLREAEVLVYDRLVNPKFLQYLHPTAEIIYAGKSPRKHTLTQDRINALLLKKARKGKIVVRLKCGDPYLFGRGAEEALFLTKHKIPFEVVPGVSAAIAVAAYAGIPLTHRRYSSSVGIFTGHQPEGSGLASNSQSHQDPGKNCAGLGTLVFLMGVENLSGIVKDLITSGRPESTPCCLIQEGTLPGQKTLRADLGTIAHIAREAGFSPPAILVVGEVVSLREKLNWFEERPLFGKKILLTRPGEPSPSAQGLGEKESRLSKILEGYGASCLEFPALEIKPLLSYRQFDSQIKRINDFQWIIFSSQNGVKSFKQRLDYLKKDARILKGVKVAAIGPATALSLENLGLRVDLQPSKFCQEGLIECFKKKKIKGENILLVRALEARDILPRGLRKMGANVKIAPAYRACKTHSARRIAHDADDIDIIAFTSSLAVKNFFAAYPKKIFKNLNKNPLIAAIGPVTSQQVLRRGYKVAIEAKRYTFEGLAGAIVRYYKSRSSR